MKKFILVVMVAIMVFMVSASVADVKIPKDVMENAVLNKDAGSIIESYMFPYLEGDDLASALFASELNISNGCPHNRYLFKGGWGERAMFGKLVTASYVMDNLDYCIPLANIYRDETYRLLFGKRYNNNTDLTNTGWINNGKTTFRFMYLTKSKLLDYTTGKFVNENNPIWVIRVNHTTEYSGASRHAYIECDWKHEKDGFYYATFGIAKIN